MDFSKLSNGAKLALVGGVVLIVDLFLPWYKVGPISLNAFDAEFLAWGGALIAIAGAVVLVLKATGQQDVKAGNFSAEQLATLLGGIGFILILLRWLTESNFVGFGLYLGLLAAAAVAAGAFMSMKDSGQNLPGMGG
jgi:hypothetical protein